MGCWDWSGAGGAPWVGDESGCGCAGPWVENCGDVDVGGGLRLLSVLCPCVRDELSMYRIGYRAI
jgi:hypothetical protein